MRSERLGRAMPKTQPLYQVLAYEEIASRANQRYLNRGSTDGYGIDDWRLPSVSSPGNERISNNSRYADPERRNPKPPEPLVF